MILKHQNLLPDFRQQLIAHTYGVIGCIHQVCQGLPAGLPEYVYQEALNEVLNRSYPQLTHKEYQFHPSFEGHELQAAVRMDFMIECPQTALGDIIIECKAIHELSDHERQQLYSYLIASGKQVGVLVNFATYPKAQIERYYFDPQAMTISAF